MEARLQKFEEARTLIFDKMVKSVPHNKFHLSKVELVEIFMMLKKPNFLIIGKNNHYRVNDLNNQKVEDMLNILQQYNLIKNYERVCGDVFKVELIFKPKADSSLIPIFKLQNIKAA